MRLARYLTTALLLAAVSAGGESKNPTDYPLRVHIFRRSETTFYHMRQEEEAKGDGRANLFENGEPKGIDFQFDCSDKLQTSSGYETFPARWKKPNEELVVLQPQFGKQGAYTTCHFKVQMKSFAYFAHNGVLGSEPTDQFKHWMVTHDYDPEHGKDTPTATRAAGASGAAGTVNAAPGTPATATPSPQR